MLGVVCLDAGSIPARLQRFISKDRAAIPERVLLVFEGTLMFPFCFVIREFQLIFTRLFVMRVAGIASFVLLQEANRNEFTSRGNMINLPCEANFFRIEGISLTELHPVKWLSSGAERFPNLRRIY